MDAAELVKPPATLTRGEWVVLGVSCVGAIGAVVAYWVPILRVYGVETTVAGSPGWRSQFIADTALPVAVLVVALASIRRWPRPAQLTSLSAATMATLAPAQFVAAASFTADTSPLSRLEPGYVVAAAAAILGVISLSAIIGTLAYDEDNHLVMNSAAALAGCGLLVAIGGQLWMSTEGRLWDLSGWLEVGRWWRLVVTAAIILTAVRWRSVPAIAAALPAAAMGLVSTVEQRLAAMTPASFDAPLTTTAIGYAVVVVALGSSVALHVRGRVGTPPVAAPAG